MSRIRNAARGSLAAAMLMLSLTAAAQRGTGTTTTTTSAGTTQPGSGMPDASFGGFTPNNSSSHDPDNITSGMNMDELRAKMANNERQRVMIRETNQILQAAAELRMRIANHPGEMSRDEMLRQLDTIEKLAHNVKDRMKH